MMTPEERRGTVLELLDMPIPLMSKVRNISETAESWIAEAVAEARRNPFAIDENEHEWVTATEYRRLLAEKDAEIERLREFDRQQVRDLKQVDAEIERLRVDLRETEALVPDPESMERELDDRLIDERRRVAEEIAQRIETVSTTPLLLHAARIAREVGGSDE